MTKWIPALSGPHGFQLRIGTSLLIAFPTSLLSPPPSSHSCSAPRPSLFLTQTSFLPSGGNPKAGNLRPPEFPGSSHKAVSRLPSCYGEPMVPVTPSFFSSSHFSPSQYTTPPKGGLHFRRDASPLLPFFEFPLQSDRPKRRLCLYPRKASVPTTARQLLKSPALPA
jgi:hypothetical protein